MTSPDSPRAELFVRADTFGASDQQMAIRRRLDDLADVGALADVETTTWQSRVRLDAPDTKDEARAIEHFRSFERWAAREDVSLEPFFETWERHSAVLDTEYRELVTPVMCVALFEGGDVVEVAPHRDGEETYAVRDCLDDFEEWAATDERDADSEDAPELTAD